MVAVFFSHRKNRVLNNVILQIVFSFFLKETSFNLNIILGTIFFSRSFKYKLYIAAFSNKVVYNYIFFLKQVLDIVV